MAFSQDTKYSKWIYDPVVEAINSKLKLHSIIISNTSTTETSPQNNLVTRWFVYKSNKLPMPLDGILFIVV